MYNVKNYADLQVICHISEFRLDKIEEHGSLDVRPYKNLFVLANIF